MKNRWMSSSLLPPEHFSLIALIYVFIYLCIYLTKHVPLRSHISFFTCLNIFTRENQHKHANATQTEPRPTPGFVPRASLLRGSSANHCTTVLVLQVLIPLQHEASNSTQRADGELRGEPIKTYKPLPAVEPLQTGKPLQGNPPSEKKTVVYGKRFFAEMVATVSMLVVTQCASCSSEDYWS